MNIDRFANPNLKIPTAIGVGLGLALGLGMWAGSGEFSKLRVVAAVAIVLVYLLFFLPSIWVIGLLICSCGFMQVGFGFTMGDLEMSLVVAGLFFAMMCWRKRRVERPPVFESMSFGLLNTMAFFWLAYVFCHTVFNIYDPYRPTEFALKNLLKVVEAWSAAILLMTYFANRPNGLIVRGNFPRRLAWCLAIGLTINIFLQLFNLLNGGDAPVGDDPDDPFGNNALMLPVLDLMENPYALRTIPPAAMLFCGAIVATRWFKERPLKERRLFYFVMAQSVIGAILSGGRGTLGFVLGLFAIFLIIRRRIGLLIGFVCVAAVIAGGVNVIPDTVKSAPPMIRRALNWALLEKDVESAGTIESSTNWRLDLFKRSLGEWQSDPRIFWFGRATYAYTMEDVIAFKINAEDATVESALRRGNTHNMITDLLVVFGLVGLILYFLLYFALLYFLWTLYKSPQLDELAKTLALVILLALSFNFMYGLLGGGGFPMLQAWFYIVLVAYIYGQHAQTVRSTESTKIEPPKDRRFTPRRPGGVLPAGA